MIVFFKIGNVRKKVDFGVANIEGINL